LLQAVGQLNKSDLDRFVQQTIALRAQRQAPSLPHTEAELLQKINQGIAPEIQHRYDVLITKRRAETLTPTEHTELLQLTGQIENLDAQRMAHLTELAQLCHTSLVELMEQLDIRPPDHA
jgi:hypothetical protein